MFSDALRTLSGRPPSAATPLLDVLMFRSTPRGIIDWEAENDPRLRTPERLESMWTIYRALIPGYRLRDIVVDSILKTAEHRYETTLLFRGTDSLVSRANHVSAVQLEDGLIQATDCMILALCRSGALGPKRTEDWFVRHWDDWSLRRQTMTFSEKVRPDRLYRFESQFLGLQEIGDVRRATFRFRGAVRAELQCVISNSAWEEP